MKHGIVRLGFVAALALSAAFAAAQSAISVTINGDAVQFSGTGPQMVNGRVLVPLRGVFEKLGAHVEWHPEHREVIASRGDNSVDLQIGNPSATVNGQPVTMDVPAEILDGSTMVPIRFVSEAIGAQVRWNEAEKLVIITADAAQPAEEPAPAQEQPSETAGQGPIRMARVSFIQGGLTWRPGDDVDWSDAGPNLPLRQGAELWLNPGGRAEIQFDDGSLLRLGNGAVATLHTMFSDDQGEFTEIRLNSGTATLNLTNQNSSYQIDTPLASVTAKGPSSFRVDATNGLEVRVRSGQAHVQGDSGQINVGGGQYLRLAGPTSGYVLYTTPGADAWDRSWDDRDRAFSHHSQYLPSSIALMGGDLDSYGTWNGYPQYGYCWRPNNVGPDWAPYRDGHWVWVSPFGWTWCSNEPWGWAPYHYGTWFVGPQGWAWRPGPAQQCWSPAVVHFSTDRGVVAWVPLAPSEVRYPPAVSVSFRLGNWAVNFAIGGAATYYPDGPGSCSPRPWRNADVNRTTNVYNITRVTNITNVYVNNNGFVPRNSQVRGGATMVPTNGFAGRGQFTPTNAANAAIFTRGKMFAAPVQGGASYAGPTNVRPTAASFSPSHAFSGTRPNPTILNRAVVRAAVPGRTSGWSQPMASARVLPVAGRTPSRTSSPRVPAAGTRLPRQTAAPVTSPVVPVKTAPPVKTTGPKGRTHGSPRTQVTPPAKVAHPSAAPAPVRQRTPKGTAPKPAPVVEPKPAPEAPIKKAAPVKPAAPATKPTAPKRTTPSKQNRSRKSDDKGKGGEKAGG